MANSIKSKKNLHYRKQKLLDRCTWSPGGAICRQLDPIPSNGCACADATNTLGNNLRHSWRGAGRRPPGVDAHLRQRPHAPLALYLTPHPCLRPPHACRCSIVWTRSRPVTCSTQSWQGWRRSWRGWASQWARQRQVLRTCALSLEAPRSTPGLKCSTPKDEFRRDNDTIGVMQFGDIREAAVDGSSLSVLWGGYDIAVVPLTYAFSPALEVGL